MPVVTPLSGRPLTVAASIVQDAILAGRFRPGDYLPTLRELHRRHGLSTETFRRALKVLESDGLVVSEPRHGFRVAGNGARAAFGCAAPGTCLFVGPPGGAESWSGMHKAVLLELQRIAAVKGMALLTVGSDRQPTDALAEKIRGSQTAGAILERNAPAIEALLREHGIPAVMVEAGGQVTMDSVVQDGFDATRQAVRFLVGSGHEAIAWIGPSPRQTDSHVVERFSGYVGGMAECGRVFLPEMVIEAPYRNMAAARELARTVLSRGRRPTAIVAPWAHMTMAVAQAAEDAGLRLNKDLALVGWTTEEAYEAGIFSRFANAETLPAMVWSVRSMVELAYARLEQRLTDPGLPVAETRVPMRVRFPEDAPDEWK